MNFIKSRKHDRLGPRFRGRVEPNTIMATPVLLSRAAEPAEKVSRRAKDPDVGTAMLILAAPARQSTGVVTRARASRHVVLTGKSRSFLASLATRDEHGRLLRNVLFGPAGQYGTVRAISLAATAFVQGWTLHPWRKCGWFDPISLARRSAVALAGIGIGGLSGRRCGKSLCFSTPRRRNGVRMIL